MKWETIIINDIPAILWGDSSEKIYIFVHGKMSQKEHAETFAKVAEEKGYQTLSFDLPQHGERINCPSRCDIWNGKKDLNTIADYVFERWSYVSLFACSLGAYFSLQTYGDRNFEKCLFQSPIVDMKWLVEHMMLWSDVTEEMLREKQEIDTDIDTLRWDYYCYIQNHPILEWKHKTFILYGALDNLQPMDSISDFAHRFSAELTISRDSEHPFMTERDYEIVLNWMKKSLAFSN